MTAAAVVYVIGHMGIGGSQRHLIDLFGAADPQRVRAHLYCLQKRAGDVFIAEAERLGVTVGDGGVGASLRGAGFGAAVFRLAAELRRVRARIVHAYLAQANVVGAVAARVAGVPVTLVSKRGLHRYPRVIDRWGCRLANRLADRVVVNAEAVRAHVERVERCPGRKIVVVPNGIDLRRVPCAPAGREARFGHRHVVGTVGRLAREKGQADLLAAAPRVRAVVPDTGFVLVGDGPVWADLERQARALGIDDAVHFLGARSDGPHVLPSLDVFVQPSHLEGMSNSLLEALAAGRPVVATDVGGTREVITDDVTGVLVEARRPDALARAVVGLLQDSERRRRLGAAGRAHVESQFTARSMFERYSALYRELLADKAGARA